jgi:hypothetical protein
MDSSALGYTLCSSAKPCPTGFCTFEYGGGEGVCVSCDYVPRLGTNSTAPCCSVLGYNGFLSGDGVKACYAACGGTEPGPRGTWEPGPRESSCKATTSVTRRSDGDSSAGSGSSYNAYYRQDSQILHLAVRGSYYYICVPILSYVSCPHTAVCVSSNYYMCPHTTHTKARLLNTEYLGGDFDFSYTNNM